MVIDSPSELGVRENTAWLGSREAIWFNTTGAHDFLSPVGELEGALKLLFGSSGLLLGNGGVKPVRITMLENRHFQILRLLGASRMTRR